MEPLTAPIQQNNKTKEIQDTNLQHKISLYADDLLSYIQNPSMSLRQTSTSLKTSL